MARPVCCSPVGGCGITRHYLTVPRPYRTAIIREPAARHTVPGHQLRPDPAPKAHPRARRGPVPVARIVQEEECTPSEQLNWCISSALGIQRNDMCGLLRLLLLAAPTIALFG